MKWTKEKPNREGFYFYQAQRIKMRVVEVWREAYTGRFMAKGVNIFHEVDRLDGKWSGPIELPEEADA